jgi:hypothetical protein
VEAQFFHNGEFRIGQRFPTRAEAVAWAAAERPDYEEVNE